jgi:hypothetical protein
MYSFKQILASKKRWTISKGSRRKTSVQIWIGQRGGNTFPWKTLDYLVNNNTMNNNNSKFFGMLLRLLWLIVNVHTSSYKVPIILVRF